MFRNFPLELLCWTGALISLAIIDPCGSHYDLCIFHLLGWQHCPGCGLGHSIAFLLRGDLLSSWRSHPLGAFALIVILNRISVLSTPYYLHLKNLLHGRKQFLGAAWH